MTIAAKDIASGVQWDLWPYPTKELLDDAAEYWG